MSRIRVEFEFVHFERKISFQCLWILNSQVYVRSHLSLTIHAHFVIFHAQSLISTSLMLGKLSAIGDAAASAVASVATTVGDNGEQQGLSPDARSLFVPLEHRFGTVFPSAANIGTIVTSVRSLYSRTYMTSVALLN